MLVPLAFANVKAERSRCPWGALKSRAARALRAVGVLGASFLAGSVPFSNLASRLWAGVDLRSVGNGTVSGSALARVAGWPPLVLAGVFEVAKGALGPLMAGRGRPRLAASAAGCAVAGHNWSPWLGGAGGRGISPAMGALLVSAPAGAAVLAGGLALGRLLGETALGSFVADLALLPLAKKAHGAPGALAAAAVLAPMVAKRLLGNAAPAQGAPKVYLYRLLFDRDTRAKPS